MASGSWLMATSMQYRLATILAVPLAFCLASPVLAQVDNLDKVTLIEALRKDNMSELLHHLVDTEKFTDETIARQVKINLLMLEYQNADDNAAKAPPENRAKLKAAGMAAFDAAIDERRKLIREFRDHLQRPLWQTDLAEQVMTQALITVEENASEFYEFGVTTAKQKAAFEKYCPEILENLTDAELRFIQIQGDVPRLKDFEPKYQNTGLWDRMMNQYYKLRHAYYLAMAAHFTAQLPDDHPYYKTLNPNNPKIPNQKTTAAEEKKRLEALAVQSLEKFVADRADQNGIRMQSLSLTGRAMLGMYPANDPKILQRTDEAIAVLDEVIKENKSDLTDLRARLARAKALQKKGQHAAAVEYLGQIAKVGLVQQNLIYSLLVTDQLHLQLLAKANAFTPGSGAPSPAPAPGSTPAPAPAPGGKPATPAPGSTPASPALTPAQQKMKLIGEAYEPYQVLLNDPRLDGRDELREQLRKYIYRRWESSIAASTDMNQLPAVVVAAVAETSREAGQDLLEQASNMPPEKAGEAKTLQGQGLAKLKRCVEVVDGLLKRQDVNDAAKAQAMFNKAVAIFYQAPGLAANQMDAAAIFVDLADQFPKEPQAEPAITDATALYRKMMMSQPPIAGGREGFDRAMKVVLAKFPLSKVANEMRYWYATEILEPGSKYVESADVLSKVPSENPLYWAAQRDRMFALQQHLKSSPKEKLAEAVKALLEAATQVLHDAEQAIPSLSGDRLKDGKQAAGWARLVLSDIAIDHERNVAKALDYLRNFDEQFADDPDLTRRMLQRRIVALIKVDQFDEAIKEARRMMNAFPDSAASVIGLVLDDIDVRIDDLNKEIAAELVERIRKEKNDRRQKLADSAFTLASMLMEWASDPKRDIKGEALLPYRIILAKSMRLTGKAKASFDLLDPLLKQFPKNADLILSVGESLYAIGGDENFGKAELMFDRIIRDIRPDASQKYPPIWWTAYMRKLQIMDKGEKNGPEIPRHVRSLRTRDAKLGGQQFKGELERLETKWSLRK